MDWKLSIFSFPEMENTNRMCLINLDLRDLREIMIEHRPREDAASEKAGEVCVNPKGERDGMV